MAKRSSESQITKENGGGDNSDDELDANPKEMPKAATEVLGARKIRGLPARKSATPTPTPESTPSAKPAFGGGFSFGAVSSPTTGAAAPSSSTPFSFGAPSSSTTPNPFASVPSIFSSPKPSPAVPVFGAGPPSTPKPAAASPFSFGGGSPSFSFGAAAVTSAPPSPAVVPPAPSAATPWGSSSTLPNAETSSASSTLKSFSGPPPKKSDSSTGSMIVEAPSTPQIQPMAISSSAESPIFSKSFGGAGNGSPFKPSPLSTSSNAIPSFNPPTSSSTKAPAPTTSSLPSEPKDNRSLVAYYRNLRGLNLSLLSLQESLVEKDPFVDLSKTLEDLVRGYKAKREELEREKKALGVVDDHEGEVVEEKGKEVSVVVEKPKFGSGGFSFGGAKLDAPAAASTGSTPFSTFPSTSPGSKPSGGFSFGGSSASASTSSPKPASTGGFSFGAPKTADVKATTPAFGSSSSIGSSATPKRSSAGSFITSVLSESTTTSTPSDPSAPKSNSFSFSAPSSASSTTAASPAPFSFASFGTGSSSSSTPPAPPPLKTTPSFQRLPGGTPNFSFGAASGVAPKRSVSSSFGFGSADAPAPSTTTTPALEASTSTPSGSIEEEAPAPTIPSDPSLMEKGVGEEGEETAWEARGAISRFSEGKWDKVGTGLVRVKFGGESGSNKGRVLARVEGSGVLLLNVSIHADVNPKIQNGKAVSISVVEKGKPSMISLRVKDAASAERLSEVLKERASA